MNQSRDLDCRQRIVSSHDVTQSWDVNFFMAVPSFKIGDRVRVVLVPPMVEKEMPPETIGLFERCVGRVLRVDGFDEHGHLELNVANDGSQAPDYSQHTIWIEPEFVEKVA